MAELRIVVDPNPCYAGWEGWREHGGWGHRCEKKGAHAGLHVCECGARAGKRADPKHVKRKIVAKSSNGGPA